VLAGNLTQLDSLFNDDADSRPVVPPAPRFATSEELDLTVHDLEAEVTELTTEVGDFRQQILGCVTDEEHEQDKHDDLWNLNKTRLQLSCSTPSPAAGEETQRFPSAAGSQERGTREKAK
jgi:hypothetical protein